MRLKTAIPVLLAGLVLAGCSTKGGDLQANDPYESFNRKMFSFDTKLDRHVLLPTAAAYVAVVPAPARDSIHNFLANLDSPVTFVNDVLQDNGPRSAQTLKRLLINTTFGLGGLFDVASRWGIPAHEEDFGQTLAVWGTAPGPYLVLPFAGPGNPRDFGGDLVDIGFDPTTYISYNGQLYWSIGRALVGVIDLRARNASIMQSIERGSVDYYASVRSLYRQNRQNEINNGKINFNNLPNF